MTNGRRSALGFAGASALVVLAGCASTNDVIEAREPYVAPALQRPAEWRSGDRPVTQALTMSAQGGERTRLVSRQTMQSEWEPAGASGTLEGGVGEVVHVQLATNQANAEELVRLICNEYLGGQSFVFDPALKQAAQPVTLSVDEELTVSEVYDLLGGLASVYGWLIENRSGVLYFRPLGSGDSGLMGRVDSPVLRDDAIVESDAPAIRIKRLRHMPTGDASTAITNLMSPGGSVVASGRTLLLVDTVRQTNRLSGILDALDVPAFEGVEINTFRLAHRAGSEAVQLLNTIANSAGLTGDGSAVSFVAVPGTSDVMVIARDPSLLPLAKNLIESIDQAGGSSVVGAYAYRVQYYDPAQLMQMVSGFFGDDVEVVSGGGVASNRTVDARSRQKMRLVMDADEELILIRATPEDYADLLSVLYTIDRPRQQVMLQAVIAEVTLNDRLEFGVDYFLNALNEDGTTIDLFGTPGLSSAATGTISILSENALAVIDALRSVSDVDVLQQPRLVVADRFQAEFRVGGEVPVLQGDLNSEGGSDTTQIRRDITYRETGLTLTITPRVNESGAVTMDISQEINDVGGESELGPTFTTTGLETQVIVPHGKTVLLAGIIEDSKRDSERRIPGLGDVPIAGVAFRNTTNETERRELLLAITPTIIDNPAQAPGTMGAFLSATDGLRAALHGRADRLPRGLLNRESMETPLGGFGEAPEAVAPAEEEEFIPAPRAFEGLRIPAVHRRSSVRDRMRRIGYWRLGNR